MPEYDVAVTEKARKDLDGMTENEADKVLRACVRLARSPEPDGKHIKKLKGYKDLYRLRIGDYRAVFKWRGNDVIVVRLLTRQDFGKRF